VRKIPLRPALLLSLGLVLYGCTAQANDLVNMYENSSESGYISGDGRIIYPPEPQRGEPVVFSGILDTGESFSSEQLAGRVAVINFWYAACPPCRKEAEKLNSLREHYPETEVAMVGVNIRDSKEVSLRFGKDFAVRYPSLLDAGENAVQLAFADTELPPNSVPTTLVLDQMGRVSARISGLIESESVLSGIIDELLGEKS